MTRPACVHFVHAVDTEGPLHESLAASFERLEELFQIGDLPRTRDTLRRLQAGEIDLGGPEVEVRQLLTGHRLDYMSDWSKLDAMLDRAMSHEFRRSLLDSEGRGWIYSWFCLDHVDFVENPRGRTMGYHAIHDHYVARTGEDPACPDEALERVA